LKSSRKTTVRNGTLIIESLSRLQSLLINKSMETNNDELIPVTITRDEQGNVEVEIGHLP
jgi:hypothetical protein